MHLLLDSAQMEGLIFEAQELNELSRCLYEGDSEVALGSVAPYLFSLKRDSYFADWLVENGSNNSWGIIIQSAAEEEELYRHLRQFLIVQKEDGKELYFRFYDPRVLRIFLPTCDAAQLEEFFGPVEAYLMEDEDGKMLRFSLKEGALVRAELNCNLEEFLLNQDALEDGEEQTSEDPPITEKKDESKWDFGY